MRVANPTRLEDGGGAARQRAVDIDRALSALYDEVLGGSPDVALIAVGGYGRGDLSPHSDIDLLFLTASRADITAATFRGVLYPLWDAGFQVGHAVRTPKATLERATTDLEAATALLSARAIAGDATLCEELLDRRKRWLAKGGARLARRMLEARAEAHKRSDRAGWTLAPDLKDGIGGLRDVHAVGWMEAITGIVRADTALETAAGTLLAVREALHAELKRKSDRLRIDLQPRVARRLGYDHDGAVDEVMSEVHGAARTVEHHSALALEELAEAALGGPRRSGQVKRVSARVRLEDGKLSADPRYRDLGVALELLAAVAETGRPIARRDLEWLTGAFATASSGRWPEELRSAFDRLLAGAFATAALELMDHSGAWTQLLPEWAGVRKLAQHDPYHRFTVDGHSFIAVGEIADAIRDDNFARSAAEEAGDLATLRLATLFHDIGKGSGADHCIAGEHLARAACERIGLALEEIDDVAALVRHHLLLPDTATRRDLDDGSVIATVAQTVETPRRLRLLYVLAVADGRATGPEAWNEWKAALVRELFHKVLIALETGELPARSDIAARAREVEMYEPTLAGRAGDVLATLPPSYPDSTAIEDIVDDVRLLLTPPKPGEVRLRTDPGTEPDQFAVTVCAPDRPGTLARTAGVLALHRMSVLRAQAYSTTRGLALERFVVRAAPSASWDGFEADLTAAYAGRLAVEARLERKAADYSPGAAVEPDVRVLQDASSTSTVVEVRAPDALGLLFAVTAALTDLDVDIHVAKIDTLGSRVVDVFYVRTAWGGKLDDQQATEVVRAIEHRIARLFG